MEDLIELIVNLGVFLGLLAAGFFWGSYSEKKHFKEIEQREKNLIGIPAIPMKFETVVGEPGNHPPVEDARMVTGSVVLSEDYFKAFLASLKTIFGGNLTSYESLMDRARREAILRMKEDAIGADMIVNLRLDTSSISKEGGADGKGPKSIEVLASGTAIYFAKR